MLETPIRPIAISPTRAFQRCNRAYRYGYVDNLKPVHLSAPIRMGIEAHKFFEDAETMGDDEALALVDQRWEALTADQRAIYQNRGKGDRVLPPLPDDLRRIVRSYRYQYQEDNWDVVGVEHKLDVEIEGRRHVGIMDLLVRDARFGPGLTLIDRKLQVGFLTTVFSSMIRSLRSTQGFGILRTKKKLSKSCLIIS